jgi:hypothetical protein
MPCQRRTTANLQARPHLTPARSFRDDIVVVLIAPWGRARWYPCVLVVHEHTVGPFGLSTF